MRNLLFLFICLFATQLMGQKKVIRGEYFFDTDPGHNAGFPLIVNIIGDSVNIDTTITIPASLSNGKHFLYVRTADSNNVWSLAASREFYTYKDTIIQKGEYYIDNDPGPGNGNPFTFGSYADTVSDSFVFNTPINLPNGLHSLYIRTKTKSGLWSIAERKDFYVYQGATISNLEYFYDSDPGLGNGTPLVLGSPADTVSDSFTIITPLNISNGLHKLYVRSKTAQGLYSITEVRDFYVFKGASINKVEYFIDTDPGLGNGSFLNIGSPSDSISDSFTIITPLNLKNGLHSLYVRTKNADGIYSLTERRDFWVFQSSLVSGEYFFDNDPGVGNGISFSVGTPQDSIHYIDTFNTTGLGNGWHQLYVRTKSVTGEYALSEGAPFFIRPQIIKAEYYLDNDPGPGNGIPVAFSIVSDSIIIDTPIVPVCAFNGVHYFCLRTMDDRGVWSIAELDTFYISGYLQKAHILPGPGPDSTPVKLVAINGAGNNYQFRNLTLNTPWKSSPFFAVANGTTNIFLIKDTLGCVLQDTIAALPKPNAISTTGGNDTIKLEGYNNYVYFVDSAGKILGAVNDYGANLDTVIMMTKVHTGSIRYTPNSLDTFPYLNRNWKLYAKNNPSYWRGLQLPFTKAEFDTLNLYSAGINTTADLKANRYNGPNENLVMNDNDTTRSNYHFVNTPAITNYSPTEYMMTFMTPSFSEFYISGNTTLGSILPVDLLTFDALYQPNHQVLVYWKTASEKNVSHFEIERSSDGKLFEKIGELAANNFNTPVSYSFSDNHLEDVNSYFYRLRMVDMDGTFKYSVIRKVVLKQTGEIKIFPNPASSFIQFSNAEQINSIEIFNVIGQLIEKVKGQAQLNISHMASGKYLLRLTTNSAVSVQPLEINH